MSTDNNHIKCFHCGNDCPTNYISHDGKPFCCLGCKTVYQILNQNNLENYYTLSPNPGTKPSEPDHKFDFLKNPSICEKLLEFNQDNRQIVSLFIPSIHCSSCIWVLENLSKLNANIIHSQVNFPKKTIRVVFNSSFLSLYELAILLSHLGYPPYISLDDYKKTSTSKVDKKLLYKLGVAAFAFGNVMLLSVPEYIGIYDYWLHRYKYFFRWLSLALSCPVLFYSASDYLISAYKGLKNKILNIDVPLSLGILSIFIRSVIDVVFDLGQGFFDSLNGLIFFLLIGKFFQQKTYNFLSFERDYKSYFPIGITVLKDNVEENIEIYNLKENDVVLVRNQEIIPADSILIRGNAFIDYSFVTGESKPVEKVSGDKLFAGGKQIGEAIEIQAIKSVSQSYLTQLWSNDFSSQPSLSHIKTLTDKISKYFTIIIIAISLASLAYWYFVSPLTAFNIFTAVLIIACPCALSMSAPFTLGNMLRIFGRHKLYLKDTETIEKMAKISLIAFDKTGTLTSSNKSEISFYGTPLSPWEISMIKSTLRNSNHPLSRMLYSFLPQSESLQISSFTETEGSGISAICNNIKIKIGSASFVGATPNSSTQTSVYISINEGVKGYYTFQNSYREGIKSLTSALKNNFKLAVLSGDNQSEEARIRELLPPDANISFNLKPHKKQEIIQGFQAQGHKVLMAGDGLNDAVALKQSDVGIAVSENINVFSPACSGIIDASVLSKLNLFLALCKKSISVIKFSFALSLLYNIVGIYLAITGRLSPLYAAILMPLSSISMVLFTTISTNIIGRKLR